jgi:hypothetical protein
MRSRQFQITGCGSVYRGCRTTVLWRVIVSGSILQLLGHLRPNDEHRTITSANSMLYSRRMHNFGHQEERVSIRYCDTFGARRPPSSQALPSDQVFHENRGVFYGAGL